MSNALERLLAEDKSILEQKQQTENKAEEAKQSVEGKAEEAETKPTETKVENKESSLTESVQESMQKETIVDDFEQRFAERLKEGEYISKDEFERIKNTPATQNELLQKLLEYDKNGVSIDRKTLAGLLEDFDSYDYKKSNDALSLMRRKLRKELGDDELVEFKLKKKYSALFEDETDTDEYREALLELQIDAKQALGEFKSEQEKLTIPDPSQKSVSREEIESQMQQEALAKQEQIKEAFSQLAENATKNFQEVNYNVLGQEVKIEVTPEQKRELKKELKSLPTFFDRHFMKDGNIDTNGLTEFLYLALNKDKVSEIIAGTFKSKGQEEEFESIKNTTQKGSTRGSSAPADNDIYSQIAKQFAVEGKTIW